MSKPTSWVVIVDGKQSAPFGARFLARAYRNIMRAKGHSAHIIAKGFK